MEDSQDTEFGPNSTTDNALGKLIPWWTYFLIREHVLSTSQAHLLKWENVKPECWEKQKALYSGPWRFAGAPHPQLHYPVYFPNSPLNPPVNSSHPLHVVLVQESTGCKSSQLGATRLNYKPLADPSREPSSFFHYMRTKKQEPGLPSWGQKGRSCLRKEPTMKEKNSFLGTSLEPSIKPLPLPGSAHGLLYYISQYIFYSCLSQSGLVFS